MNIPIATIMCDVLDRYQGQTLTPDLVVDICSSLIDTVYPGTLDVSMIPPKKVGSYNLMCVPVATVIREMQDAHRRHWEETEEYRHDAEFRLDYGRVMEVDKQGRYLMIAVEHTPTGTLVGNFGLLMEQCIHTQLLSAYEDVLYIEPEHRRGRVGVELIRYAEDVVRRLGARELTLSARTVTKVGPMLERMGFDHFKSLYNKRLMESSHVRKRA